jgi:ferredoxin
MKAFIERNGCIGCGLCTETCPAAFRLDEEGIACVYKDPIPSEAEKTALEAAENCPVSVITIE